MLILIQVDDGGEYIVEHKGSKEQLELCNTVKESRIDFGLVPLMNVTSTIPDPFIHKLLTCRGKETFTHNSYSKVKVCKES